MVRGLEASMLYENRFYNQPHTLEKSQSKGQLTRGDRVCPLEAQWLPCLLLPTNQTAKFEMTKGSLLQGSSMSLSNTERFLFREKPICSCIKLTDVDALDYGPLSIFHLFFFINHATVQHCWGIIDATAMDPTIILVICNIRVDTMSLAVILCQCLRQHEHQWGSSLSSSVIFWCFFAFGPTLWALLRCEGHR